MGEKVGVASQNHGIILLFAQLHDAGDGLLSAGTEPAGDQGCLVDLQNAFGANGRRDQLPYVDGVLGLPGMTDDVHMGVFHGVHVSRRVLLKGTRRDAGLVEAGDAYVVGLLMVQRDVHLPLKIQYIKLCSAHYLNAEKMVGHSTEIEEISACIYSGHGRSVVCYAYELKADVRGITCVFRYGAVCVHTGDGMGVRV